MALGEKETQQQKRKKKINKKRWLLDKGFFRAGDEACAGVSLTNLEPWEPLPHGWEGVLPVNRHQPCSATEIRLVGLKVKRR